MSKFLILLILLASPLGSSLAQIEEEITITQRIITPDPIPPSTPVISSVTPVSDTQIDVVWVASTDNIGVQGYQVFRDLTKVATTSLTTFSDTGLTPSTTYSYTVVAFDALRNYSTSSTAVATTTLQAPAPPPTPTSTTPTSTTKPLTLSGVVPKLSTLEIDTGTNHAWFAWQTNRGVAYELRWGRTADFEQGFIASDRISRSHQTSITGLAANTVYQFELIAVDGRGRKVVLETGTFTTRSLADNTAPANVSGLRATLTDTGVALSWSNPLDEDFAYVRIVRSHLFFPADPAAGFLVYEGAAMAAADPTAFQFGDVAYYTAFAYDAAGNVSSGAVVFIEAQSRSTESSPSSPAFPEWDTSTTIPEVELVPGSSDMPERTLRLSDVSLVQHDQVWSLGDLSLQLDGAAALTISIPYTAVPTHLKSLLVEFAHPDQPRETFVFLLRINQDRTAYEATIAPLQFGGLMPVRVLLFDFANQTVHALQTAVLVDEARTPLVPAQSGRDTMPIILFVSGLLFLLLILLLLRYWLQRTATD